MLTITMSCLFNFEIKGLRCNEIVFQAKNIVGSNIGLAYCNRYLGRWMCIDEENNELSDFKIECPNQYIWLRCKLVFKKGELETAYVNFKVKPEVENIVTIPSSENHSHSNAHNTDDPVMLENVNSLLFKRGDVTESNRGQHFDQLIPMAGNELLLDKLFCKNMGFDGQKINWNCSSSSITIKYRLWDVDIICEGWGWARDSFIVPGSCYANYLVERK